MCKQLVLCCRSGVPHHSASRSADRPQSRRGCAPVSAPSQCGPGADVNSSVTLCAGAHDCVRVRAHVHASSCMPVHACPRETSACMIWRMQTRAYVDVGAGVGVSVGVRVGLHAQAPYSRLPLHVRPTISASRSTDRPQSRRRCGPLSERAVPGADVNSSVTFMPEGVPVRAHVPWCVCVIVHACACVHMSPQRA